ncbi:MAG: hypothetical protein JNK45_13715 [Myxococcales bacterium]|jgi:hypothetical protein|nr:hypothetical protein [Myxococcales bacterium]
MKTAQSGGRRPPESDLDLTLAVARARGPNRMAKQRQARWDRDLWQAYVLDGPGRRGGAANEPPAEPA